MCHLDRYDCWWHVSCKRKPPGGPGDTHCYYSEEDFEQLMGLFRAFFTWHRQLLGNKESLSDVEATEIARQSLGQAHSWTVVAEDASIRSVSARWEERDGAFFGKELFVRPECRNRGIGTRLQQEVERRVAEGGAFLISVIPQNRQMLAYARRHGYDTVNIVELRKELLGERPRRGRVKLTGLVWKTL